MDLLRSGIRFERQQTFRDDREMLFGLGYKELQYLGWDLAIFGKIRNIGGRYLWCNWFWCCGSDVRLRSSAFYLRARHPVAVRRQNLLFAFDWSGCWRYILDLLR